MIKLHEYLTFLFLIISTCINSQELTFRKYTVADGLPQTQVMQMLQDGKGYIWLATKNGISRFDGVEFTNYSLAEGLPEGLIYSIYVDKNDTVWALSKSGMSKFTGNRFIHYPINEKGRFNTYGSITECRDSLWFYTDKNDKRYLTSFKNGCYSDIELPKKAYIYRINSSDGDTLFLAYADVTYAYVNGKLQKVVKKELLKNKYKIIVSDNDSVVILRERDKFFLRGVPDQLISFVDFIKTDSSIYLIGKDSASKLLWEKEYVNKVLQDKNGTIWIATEGGLYKYNSDAFLNFLPEHGLNKNIWSVVEDNAHNFWFVSFTKGLQLYDGENFHEKNEIFKVRKEPLYVGARLLSNGQIYFPTQTGVICWDGKEFSDVEWAKGETEIVYENPVTKEIIIGSVDGMILKKGDTVKQFKELSYVNSGYVMGVSYDKKGFYWLVTNKTIVRFDGKDILFFDDIDVPLKAGITTDVDSLGNIWVGGYEGLFYYSYSEAEFTPALPPGEMQIIKFIKVMDDNRLLVGRTKDLLIVYLDKFFARKPDYLRVIDRCDGYIGLEPKQNGVLKDSKGYYWINASNGVFRFDDSRLIQNKQAPILHLSNVFVLQKNNTWQLKQNMKQHIESYIDTLLLENTENNLRINYTGISSGCPEGVKYKYRLKGYSQKWTKPDNKRYAEFQNLKPGKYTFELLSANSDNIWNDKPQRLVVIIKPAFWQTMAFIVTLYLLSIIITGGIIYLYLKRREARKRTVEKQQSEYARMQINQIIRQFDPHFTFNVVSIIGGLILAGDKERAYDYLIKLSELLRVTLHDYDVFYKTLEEEISFLNNYLDTQKLVIGDKLSYSIDIDENVDMKAKVPKMLIHNFVENSIKHGIRHKVNGGHVVIKISQNNSRIIVIIEDNGIGRDAAKELGSDGTHKGHRITNELFNLINKMSKRKIEYEIIDLYNSDNKPSGTKVIVYIPPNLDK
ncbi:MAG: hypothetical protein GXO47_00085 [Chlorobi bacterium]|nr:hypothetical protein [Chlorobiota bacterium]